MNALQAILLGVLQGLTEFLPVSSSGHLAIFQNLLHIGQGVEDLFLLDILLHLGTLLSIFAVFYKDIFKMIVEFFLMVRDAFLNIPRMIRHEERVRVISTAYRKFVIMVIISTIPTGIVGMIFKKTGLAESTAETLLIPGIFLLITAGLLFVADRTPEGEKTPKTATYLDAILIGIGQGIATLPGISRSGTTITSSLLCGFRKDFAVKYSFIVSMPAVLGAVVLEIGDAKGTKLEPAYFLGMAVAAVVGFFAIKVMLNVVRNKRYIFFSIYCLLAGLVAIIGSFFIK
ncbi:MAG: undecaprenyl-diphosphate phosphatase [Lachnospiraceae bacterium]|nr:undecaprenyl-diphosphate phosphatase [Lachnospiraceae bacterium]